MKFQDYEYKRPNYNEIKQAMEGLFGKIKTAPSFGKAAAAAMQIDKIREQYISMQTLCSLHFSLDTNDAFYTAEKEYFDEFSPYFSQLNADYFSILMGSRFAKEFENFYGVQFMKKAECKKRCINDGILAELQEQSRLVSQNSRLTSGASIEFQGKKLNLSLLSGYFDSQNRETRKEAAKAYYGYFEEISEKTEDNYDKLVAIRDKIAHKMGFESYIDFAYINMNRIDYNSEMVAKFRSYVEKYIVPVATELSKRQSNRLGLCDMQFYDEPVRFLSGNPKPCGSAEDILLAGEKMFSEMSAETDEFFKFMRNHGLIDVVSRQGKDGGAFSSFINNYRAPYLYANFNGTLGDVNVLTHEAGHAFQSYMSRNITPAENCRPTIEAAEVHSMSMEFFALPYIESFFGADADKYRFIQVEKALQLIPYAVAVDEFQHLVYASPKATPAEHRKMWRDTEKKYLPHRKYSDCPFLESGTWWHRQGHIFSSPFYYIEYALAQTCAFEFLIEMQENYSKAWHNYTEYCKLGGTQPFLSLLKTAGIGSPFKEETVKSVAEYTKKYLNNFNDFEM